MLVKNEVDVVGYVLKDAEKWADKIFILDNGSTDGTWELIQSLKNNVITPWKQYFGEYHNGLRADVYNEFKHLCQPGDWWCYKLDADEFFVDDPREFLASLPATDTWVSKQSIDYKLTKEDVEEYTFTDNFETDKEFLKYYYVPMYSEGRFFKYRKGLKWTNEVTSHYPAHAGVMSDSKILVRHYQFRSPNQIMNRIKTRHAAEAFKVKRSWGSEQSENWEDYLKNRSDLVYDDGDIAKIKANPTSSGKFKQSFFKKTIKCILIKLGLY